MVRIGESHFFYDGKDTPSGEGKNDGVNSPSVFLTPSPEPPATPEATPASIAAGLLAAVNWAYEKFGGKSSEVKKNLSPKQERYQLYLENGAVTGVNAKKIQAKMPDFGNGKIDKPIRQIANICVSCAGLNSLSSTETGNRILKGHLYKDETKQIYAIHLKEAENNHLPEPKGDGIYTFSLQQIMDIQNSETGMLTGEGDAAAYVLALEQYLKECHIKKTGSNVPPNGKNFFSEGMEVSRFYEIISGTKCSTKPENYFQKGVSGANIDVKHSNESEEEYKKRVSYTFDKIFEIAKNQTGSTILAISISNNNESKNIHAHSVIGAYTRDDGEKCFLIQESNLSENKDLKRHGNDYPPTYEMTKDEYSRFICSFTTYVF